MRGTIIISDLVGVDIRSRSTVSRLKQEISNLKAMPVSVDFTGVSFLSRSVADELINIRESFKDGDVLFVGLSDEPKAILDIVSKSRKMKRVRGKADSHITVLPDMKSLKEYFATF